MHECICLCISVMKCILSVYVFLSSLSVSLIICVCVYVCVKIFIMDVDIRVVIWHTFCGLVSTIVWMFVCIMFMNVVCVFIWNMATKFPLSFPSWFYILFWFLSSLMSVLPTVWRYNILFFVAQKLCCWQFGVVAVVGFLF